MLIRREASWCLLASISSMLPIFLLGSVAPTAEFGLSHSALGQTTSVFRGALIFGSLFAGRLLPRIGIQRAAQVGLSLVCLCMLGVALLGVSSWRLGILYAVAGASAGVTLNAATVLIARARVGRNALSLGIQQSASPCASLISGILVPAFVVTAGWKFAFVIVAVLVAIVILFSFSGMEATKSIDPRASGQARPPGRPLLRLAIIFGLGFSAASVLGVFFVGSLIASGMAPGSAGALLAFGSVVSIAGRIVAGYWADHHGGLDGLLLLMFLGGTLGFILVGFGGITALLFGVFLAFGLGWGSSGLVFALAARAPDGNSPRTMGYLTATGALGGIIGPLMFGTIADQISMSFAWFSSAIAMLLAALLLGFGKTSGRGSERAP